jgi:antitoxin HicB
MATTTGRPPEPGSRGNPPPAWQLPEDVIDRRVRELLARPYQMVVRGDPEEGYLAEAPELPGCFTIGETPEEALARLRDAMAGWFEVMLRDGQAIPEAEPEPRYSGRFLVRLPRTLHRELARRAEREGVSLNALVTTYLARQVGIEASRAGEVA